MSFTATVDELEKAMAEAIANGAKPAAIKAVHHFAPGVYMRECHIPAGTCLTSAIHLTEHPFIISDGEIAVISENEETVTYIAPHHGITLPGTRRLLIAKMDTIWTTIHANPDNGQDIAAIGARILDDRPNPLIPPNHPALDHGWQSQPHNLPEP